MNKIFIKNNITLFAMIIFIFLYLIIVYLKPSFIFEKNGNIRNFGIGTKKKTVIPLWFAAIILSIMSYFCLMYGLEVSY